MAGLGREELPRDPVRGQSGRRRGGEPSEPALLPATPRRIFEGKGLSEKLEASI